MHPLLCQHPQGDLISPLCPHWVPDHPEGHDLPRPCIHATRLQIGMHREGNLWVPDFQVIYEHENDGFQHVGCTHLHLVHPNGNCNFGPCVHPLLPVRRDQSRNIIYYTSNADVQTAVETAYDRLTALGVRDITQTLRPLLIFHHAQAVDGGQTDLVWSHYDPVLHAIQIMQGHSIRETVFHEMGHAILNHGSRPITTLGAPHDLDQPTFRGDAMAEGWADFVSCAIPYTPSDKEARLGGYLIEGTPGQIGNINVELDVARFLWDLYDTSGLRARLDPRTGRWLVIRILDDDTCRLSFADLFKVFNPTLQALTTEVVVTGVDDYKNQLINIFPDQRQSINDAYIRNFG